MAIQPERPCREHERVWNGYYVDKNLKDEWLERLNCLPVFELINICEGITERRGAVTYDLPHIYCRVKPRFSYLVAHHFNDIRLVAALQSICSPDDTRVQLDVKRRFSGQTKTLSYIDHLVLRLTFLKQRSSRDIDRETERWFERMMCEVEALNEIVYGLW